MTRTLTSVVALGFGLGLPAVALAETVGLNGEEQERLEAAGFEGARILPGIEVARVTGEDGDVFYVLSGLDLMIGVDHQMDRAELDPATQGPEGATPGLPATGAEAADDDVVADDDDATTLTPGQEAGDAVEAAEAAPAGMAEIDAETEQLAEIEPELELEAGDVGAGEIAGEGAAEPEMEAEAGDLADAVEHGLPLEERLEAAGFDDYEILEDARVAEVTFGGEGDVVHVILGIGEGDGDG